MLIQSLNTNAQTSAIGNYVWYDANRNSMQDVNEVGIANVMVILTKAGGARDTTFTNNNGKYLFSNLPQGTYSLHFTTPIGMTAVLPNLGNDSLDSDINLFGTIGNFDLLDNTTDSTRDAGFGDICSTGVINW